MSAVIGKRLAAYCVLKTPALLLFRRSLLLKPFLHLNHVSLLGKAIVAEGFSMKKSESE